MPGTRKVAVEQGFHNHVLPAERTVMLQQEPNRVPRVEPMKIPPEARLHPNAVRHFYRPPTKLREDYGLRRDWPLYFPRRGGPCTRSQPQLHLPLCTGPQPTLDMFKLLQVGPECTMPQLWTCLKLFNLDLTTQNHGLLPSTPNTYKLVHY